jgi:hypothetical protein
MSLGVHFALAVKDHRKLVGFTNPADLLEFLAEDLETRYLESRTWAFRSDKAWDAIHRSLTDGKLEHETGPYPLAYAVLGGKHLPAGDGHTACLLEVEQVKELVPALAAIEKEAFMARYRTLADTDYAGTVNDTDAAETWKCFVGLRTFFEKAKDAARPVLFSVEA